MPHDDTNTGSPPAGAEEISSDQPGGVGDRARRAWSKRWLEHGWTVLAAVVASVPIVVAGLRAVARGWIPISDNAIIEVRSADVLTRHHPLLGTRSSASSGADLDLNHPGPLLFDVLALPVRVLGGDAGVVVGVVAVNVAAAIAVAWLAARNGGRLAAVLASLAFAFVAYTMGSELLFDPWNPHVLVLSCLALLAAAWAVARRDPLGLPVYLAIGSFEVQTHIGYVYLVPLLLLAALVIAWRVPQDGGAPWPPATRTWAWSTGVVAVLWSQPLVEQLFGSGQGNIARLLSAAADNESRAIGGRLATRLVASVLTTPPWTARDGFVEAVPFTLQSPGGGLERVDTIGSAAAILALAVVVAVLVGLGVRSWRRDDRTAVTALAIGGAALVIALVSVALMPISPIGLSPHQMRWLWPISAWIWFAVAFALVRELPARPAVAATALAGATTVVLAALTIPNFVQPVGPAERAWQIPIVADLDAQLGSLEGRGPVLVDTRGVPLYDAYSGAVIAELRARGIPFRVDDEGLVRQFGEARRYRDDAALRLYLRQGRDALVVPPGDERVALSTPLSAQEVVAFLVLEARLVSAVCAGEISLSADGVVAARAGELPVGEADLAAPAADEATRWVEQGEVARWWDRGFLVADDDVADALTSYSRLRVGSEFASVAVLVSPITAG